MNTFEGVAGREVSKAEHVVRESLLEAGLPNPEPQIVEREVDLEEFSQFNEDSRKIRVAVERIMDYVRKSLKLEPASNEDVAVAAILHDIGKGGPADASREERLAVIKLYAAESVRNPDQPIEETVRQQFSGEAEDMLAKLRHCGVDTTQNMRAFWDMHGVWTHDVLEKWPQGISRDTRVIAATHHIDRGINPYHIPATEVPIQAKAIGTMEYYIEALELRALIVADKLEASMRRFGRNHKEALEMTKKLLGPAAENDEATKLVLQAADELGKSGQLFAPEAFRAAA